MLFITYWLFILIISFIAFAPGFAVASRIKNVSIIDKISVSFGFSFVIIATLVLFFALKWNLMAQILFIGIMTVSLWHILKKKSEFKLEMDSRFLVLIFILGIVSKFFLQTL